MNFCTSCGTAITDRFCPSCGAAKSDIKTVTIEQTGKEWKQKILIGAGLIVGGLILSSMIGAWGALVIFIGLIVTIYAGIGKWWNHG